MKQLLTTVNRIISATTSTTLVPVVAILVFGGLLAYAIHIIYSLAVHIR